MLYHKNARDLSEVWKMQTEKLQAKKGWTQGRADFMIALVAIAWGSSYVMMKVGLDGIPPFSL